MNQIALRLYHFKCRLQGLSLSCWKDIFLSTDLFCLRWRREFKIKSVTFPSNTWIPWFSRDCWLGYWSNPQEFPSCTYQPTIKKKRAYMKQTRCMHPALWKQDLFGQQNLLLATADKLMLARADSASLFWLCFRSAFLCTASGLSTVTVLHQQNCLDAAPNTYLQEKQLPFVEGSEFTKISLAGKKDLQTQFQAFWI